MHADLDLLLIEVFCTADDFLPEKADNARRKLTDAEVITLCVAQSIMGIPSDGRFLASAPKQLGHLFPNLPKRPGFHKRRRLLAEAIEALIAEFARRSPGWEDDLLLVDSTPVECARSLETTRRSALADAADYGYCASHSRFFWGFRLHGLFASDGTPRALALTSPKLGEREVCLELLERVERPSQLTVIGDKGYAGHDFEAEAADLGVTIVRPRRRDEDGEGPHLAPIRQRVESIFQTLKDLLTLERHGARTLAGLRARLCARFLTLAAAISLRAYLGRTYVNRVETPCYPRRLSHKPPAVRPVLDHQGMSQNFLAADRDQPMLLPPDLRDWLAEDHLAWFVIEAIEELDLDAFYAAYRSDGHGRAAHEPKMMLTLLAYSYSVGERSSRGIERRCREDVAFRVITANQAPDHATIARFRVRHETALADLFGQVLGLCAQAGLVEVGVLAVDGTKLAASASNHATRSYEQIAAEILDEAGRIDAAEDEIHGEARGDELPEHLASREGRRAWLREAKERLERERAATQEPVPRDRPKRLEICHRRLVEDWRTERRANRDYEAYRGRGVMNDGRRFGRPPDPHTPPAQPGGKINLTDPDSKNMKAFRGYLQGYNAQAVTTERQIIVAAEIAPDGLDFAQLDPMITAAERELEAAGIVERPGVVLADAGYWSNGHIDALRERGITPIIAPDAHSREGPRKTRLGGPYDFMRRVLATDQGVELYSRRQWMVEPVFAQVKANRRIDRFKRRGRAAARSEWRLIAATNNLLKLHRHSLATETA